MEKEKFLIEDLSKTQIDKIAAILTFYYDTEIDYNKKSSDDNYGLAVFRGKFENNDHIEILIDWEFLNITVMSSTEAIDGWVPLDIASQIFEIIHEDDGIKSL